MDDRRDDWSRGVDKNLGSLNSGLLVLQRDRERESAEIHRLLGEIDHILRGDPERETTGLVARIEEVNWRIARLDAVIFQDSTGEHGLVHDVKQLKSGAFTSGERWKFATAVSVAIISLIGLLMTNWGRVLAFLNTETIPFELADGPNTRSNSRPQRTRHSASTKYK